MFARLFGRQPARATAPSTGGRLIYAVGDVHGRLDVLGPCCTKSPRTPLATRRGAAPARFPGRLRGSRAGEPGGRRPHPADEERPIRGRTLKGNHEEALLQFLAEPAFGAAWMEHGGAATLVSYGVQPPARRTDPQAWAPRRATPSPRRCRRAQAVLRGPGADDQVVGDYAFVHAGVRPGVPLEAQAETDLLWIRQEFLADRGPFEKVIVHGHTPLGDSRSCLQHASASTPAPTPPGCSPPCGCTARTSG